MSALKRGKVGKGGVGGQDQDQRGRGDHCQVGSALAAEDRAGQLRDDGFLLGGHGADGTGQETDAQEERAQDGRHPDQRDAGVAAARLAEGGDAVGDRLDAGQGRGAAGKGVQDQEAA